VIAESSAAIFLADYAEALEMGYDLFGKLAERIRQESGRDNEAIARTCGEGL
jgi:hypothetical protein